jgi:excisionase family DNA binding protein
MTTYLNVQRAARRLGVSPVTIRRWTSGGFLPCTRTAGGHRRIAVEDIDEMARTIGGSTQLAARLARERELDTLVETSIAVGSQHELGALLAEIAKHMTRLLDCQFCAISEYDRENAAVTALAEYDATGNRLPTPATYRLREFPLTKKVLDEQTVAVVNVDDRRADGAEVAALRREGDRSIIIIPLIYRDESIGVVEVIDSARSRKYGRQELRLARAVAGQAAVALRNARMFAEFRRTGHEAGRLRRALSGISAAVPDVADQTTRRGLMERLAAALCDSLAAMSCVIGFEGETAGAFHRSDDVDQSSTTAGRGTSRRGDSAHVLVGGDPGGRADISITLALAEPAAESQAELLDLVAVTAAAALARLPARS